MDRATYQQFRKKRDRHFRSHRDTPAGRNFVFWDHDGHNSKASLARFRNNMDAIFPSAPGAGI